MSRLHVLPCKLSWSMLEDGVSCWRSRMSAAGKLAVDGRLVMENRGIS